MMEFPPNKILVPIDLSDLSLMAWRQAEAFATAFGCAVEAVHIHQSAPALPPEIYPLPRHHRKWKSELRRFIHAKIGEKATVHLLEGDPIEGILQLIRTLHPQLVIMGSHGWTGYNRVMMGSVSEAVVRRSPVPVMTTRRKPRPIRSILAPVNFTSYADEALDYAAQAAVNFNSKLTVFHAAEESRKEWKPKLSLESLLAKIPRAIREICEPEPVVVEGNPVQKILSASKHHDLVVLAAHRKSMLKDWVLGTTAERILRQSPVPVLSIPSPTQIRLPARERILSQR